MADKRTTAGCGYNFISVETQCTEVSECPATTVHECRAKGLGGILYHGNSIPSGNLHDAVHFGRHTVKVYGYNGGRLFACKLHTVLYGLFQKHGIHVPGVTFTVDKHRTCAKVDNRIATGRESEVLTYHFIITLDTGHYQTEMYGCRTGRKSHHIRYVEEFFETMLEFVNHRPEGNNPSGFYRLVDIFLLISRKMRNRKLDHNFIGYGTRHTARTAYSPKRGKQNNATEPSIPTALQI